MRRILKWLIICIGLSACVQVPELEKATEDIRDVDYPDLLPLPPRGPDWQSPAQQSEEEIAQLTARADALTARADRLRNVDEETASDPGS